MPRPTPKAEILEEVDLGYLIARVVRTYNMGYEATMSLPMRVFWELSGQVDRIRADEARMQFQVGVALQRPESAEAMNQWFDKVAPGPFKLTGHAKMMQSSEADQAGLNDLRALAG